MDLTLPKVGLRVLRKWHVLSCKGSMGDGIGRQGHGPTVIWKDTLHCSPAGRGTCQEGRAGVQIGRPYRSWLPVALGLKWWDGSCSHERMDKKHGCLCKLSSFNHLNVIGTLAPERGGCAPCSPSELRLGISWTHLDTLSQPLAVLLLHFTAPQTPWLPPSNQTW